MFLRWPRVEDLEPLGTTWSELGLPAVKVSAPLLPGQAITMVDAGVSSAHVLCLLRPQQRIDLALSLFLLVIFYRERWSTDMSQSASVALLLTLLARYLSRWWLGTRNRWRNWLQFLLSLFLPT